MKKKDSTKKDQHTIVLEGIRSDFKVFGESLTILNQKVDRGFSEVNKRLDSHQEMIGQLTVDVAEIKNELKQKIDRTEFATLQSSAIQKV